MKLTLGRLFLVSLAMVVVEGAVACSPLPGPPIQRYRDIAVTASTIFVGRIEQLTSAEEPIPNAGVSLEVLVASVSTADTIKGVKSPRHQVRTPKSSAACGVSIHVGETYLFATKGDQIAMAILLADGRPRDPKDEEAFNALQVDVGRRHVP